MKCNKTERIESLHPNQFNYRHKSTLSGRDVLRAKICDIENGFAGKKKARVFIENREGFDVFISDRLKLSLMLFDTLGMGQEKQDSHAMSDERQNATGEFLDRLADESGLAVVVVDENSREIAIVNNNSMCRALYSSSEFAPHCERFCGRAFEMAATEGKAVDYECHAGLECRVVPVTDGESQRAIITGRAFVTSENYRIATGRVIEGDWQQFEPGNFFENVLIEGSFSPFEKLSHRIERADEAEKAEIFALQKGPENDKPEPSGDIAALIDKFHRETTVSVESDETALAHPKDKSEIAAWRSLFGSLLGLSYAQARLAIFDYLSTRHGLTSMTWFEHIDGHFENVLAAGEMKFHNVRLKISPYDSRLMQAARKESVLELRNRRAGSADFGIISLFPIAVGGEIRCAIAISDPLGDGVTRSNIARFCQTVGPELEILRLREVLSERSGLTRAVRRFNENLKKVDLDDFWLGITQISAEIMQAERASLLIGNPESEGLITKASIGIPSRPAETESVGHRVAQKIFDRGEPLLVSDIDKIHLKPVTGERRYKTDSFLSYPLAIGGRSLAVLNFSDKADGRTFEEADLELLHSIAPQMALAIDRAMLKDKAGEYEQLSVTDALTGLLNRRYLEERLTEEIKRSNRHGYPMSFMMIDVDSFKAFNDSFGHPEGDKVLKIVGQVLRETLRGADVAARYGGEEFSILLPQTTSEEAHTIAERIRSRIEETDFIHRVVTVSIGIASCSMELNSADSLIAAADKALYEAKRVGRNNVMIYENLEVAENGS